MLNIIHRRTDTDWRAVDIAAAMERAGATVISVVCEPGGRRHDTTWHVFARTNGVSFDLIDDAIEGRDALPPPAPTGQSSDTLPDVEQP